MRQGRRYGLSAEQKAEIWQRWKVGESLHEFGRVLGKFGLVTGNPVLHALKFRDGTPGSDSLFLVAIVHQTLRFWRADMPATRSVTTLAIAFVMCSLTPVSASQVGIKTFIVQDTTRKDTLKPRLIRSWNVDLYYPTDSASMRKSPYLEDEVILKKLEADKYYGISQSALESWGTKPGPAIRNAPQLTNERRPLVIILPGMGTIRANYAILASKFVNRGFVVAVIDLPYLGLQRLPDGRILQADDDPLATSEDPAAYAPRNPLSSPKTFR